MEPKEAEKINTRLDKIEEWQREQDRKLDKLGYNIFGDGETGQIGMKTKTDEMYKTITGWQLQFAGAKKIVLAILMILTSGAGAAIWSAIQGG